MWVRTCSVRVLVSFYVVFLQGLPGSIPWGVYSSYLHDILANEKKFSADSVNSLLSPHSQASSLFIFFGIGAAFGNALSGLICRFFYRLNRSYLPLAIAIGYLVSMPLLSVLFSPSLSEGLSVSVSFLLHALLLAVLGVLLNIPGPALKSILLNVNRPQCRATATAIGEVFNNAGRIVGPIVFTQLLKEGDRVAATLKVSGFFYVSAALSFLLRFTIERDEDAVQEYVQNMKLSPLSPMSVHEEKTEKDPLLQHV